MCCEKVISNRACWEPEVSNIGNTGNIPTQSSMPMFKREQESMCTRSSYSLSSHVSFPTARRHKVATVYFVVCFSTANAQSIQQQLQVSHIVQGKLMVVQDPTMAQLLQARQQGRLPRHSSCRGLDRDGHKLTIQLTATDVLPPIAPASEGQWSIQFGSCTRLRGACWLIGSPREIHAHRQAVLCP